MFTSMVFFKQFVVNQIHIHTIVDQLFAQHELFRVHQPCIHLVQVSIHSTIPMLTT